MDLCKSECLALAGVLLAVSLPAFAHASSSSDKAGSTIEIAMMVGEVQALADICSPPANTYQQVLDEAKKALPRLYANAGLEVDQIGPDIDQGRQDEMQRHDDIGFPLNCDLFPKQVSAISAHLDNLRNQ